VTYKVVLSPAAKSQAKEAKAFYKKISPRLAQEWKDELASKLKGLSAFNSFEIKYKDVRGLPLTQFPYMLYFRVEEEPAIVYVIAILHFRQNQ
jgi:plasmid stabilization system protein ParE